MSILIGINDTWRRYDKNDPTSVESFEASYRELLDATAMPARPGRAVPAAGEATSTPSWREDLDPKIEVVRKLAREYDAILVPADVELNKLAAEVGPATLADDGVHPSAAGHEALADIWQRYVLAP